MARPVIKGFTDKSRGGKIYSPLPGKRNVYEGDREEELFTKGYLGEPIKEDEEIKDKKADTENKAIDQEEAPEEDTAEDVPLEVTLAELTKDQLKELLDEKNIEYTDRNTKVELIELLLD